MKMQLITIKPKKSGIDNGFTIKRELFDNCGPVDTAYCNIDTFRACDSGFIASGFSSLESPVIEHDFNNVNELAQLVNYLIQLSVILYRNLNINAGNRSLLCIAGRNAFNIEGTAADKAGYVGQNTGFIVYQNS